MKPSLSLTHFIFDFSNYSRRSLHHVPFFVSFVCWFVLIDLYMSIQSCAIDCILHYFHLHSLQSRGHWNPTEFGIYVGMEVLQIAAIFWHKGSYLACSMLMELLQRHRVISCHFRSNFFPYYKLRLS